MHREFQSSVKLTNVSAVFRMPDQKVYSIKEYILRKITFQITYSELFALNGINLEVSPGEVFGIIGRNGAGKSTMLKIVSRVLPPTQGAVRVCGRVAPLLSLGAGFNSELTGRENIYLNGAIMCLSQKEIDDRIDQIIEFAELDQFIDMPVRTYSSGMVARLGFAVATSVDADILIIDEILSVGDEDFKKKSYARIEDYKNKGVTIMLVSHNLRVIQELCNRVMWLEKGITKMVGDPKEVVNAYREDFKNKSNQG